MHVHTCSHVCTHAQHTHTTHTHTTHTHTAHTHTHTHTHTKHTHTVSGRKQAFCDAEFKMIIHRRYANLSAVGLTKVANKEVKTTVLNGRLA